MVQSEEKQKKELTIASIMMHRCQYKAINIVDRKSWGLMSCAVFCNLGRLYTLGHGYVR
jgi:hypothetical protein